MIRQVKRQPAPPPMDAYQPGMMPQQRFAQTWTSNLLVPLAQNIVGGVAVAGLGVIGIMASTGAITPQPALWCALGGGVVTCIATVVRFFGDETGMMVTAYRMGYHAGRQNAETTINRLTIELTRIKHDAAATNATHGAIPVKLSTDQNREHQIYLDALRLLQWAKSEHVAIDRRSCEKRGMSQTAWNNARQLLLEAGVMIQSGYFAMDLPDAMQTLRRAAQARAVIAVQVDTGEYGAGQGSAATAQT